MIRLIEGIFGLFGGLIAFFVVQVFVDNIPTSGWTATEVTLVTIVLPAVVIIGAIAGAFLGSAHLIERRGPRPPERRE